jgi:PAS domain-containing protein
MIGLTELGTLFGGMRASVTVADEEYRIVFMNDLAIKHYAYGGGEALIGTDLLDCHNADSQAQLRQMYARYRAGDLTPTRYREDKGDDLGKGIVFIPLVVKGQFRGVAELIWKERSDLVFEE